MYVCMYVCTYVCMYVCMCVCVCVCVSALKHENHKIEQRQPPKSHNYIILTHKTIANKQFSRYNCRYTSKHSTQ
jgi:hypothetical protein